MEISTSTNICAFTPRRERNGFDFCIAQCAQGGYKVLDINFCESMNPHSRMRNDDWQDYVKDIAEMGRRWGVVSASPICPITTSSPRTTKKKSKPWRS